MHDVIVSGVGVLIGILVMSVQSHAKQKGATLATKEDVGEITRKVEEVRRESQSQLERLRAELAQADLINRSQYEAELAAYREMWEALLPVNRAAVALRPMVDFMAPEATTQESRRKERLTAFANTFNPFSEIVWKHRPFYPAPVFQQLSELLRLMHSEALEYQLLSPEHDREYWEKAAKNIKAINGQVERICEAIRERLSVARVAS